jgi:uncharacterized protein involved in exopolysaccharide biosynthesis
MHETAMVATVTHEQDDQISFYELLAILWARRWLILSITVLATLATGVATLVVEKKYLATVIVSPVTSAGSNSQLGAVSTLASQFGGLASLAGISVSGDTKKSESLAVLQSEALTENFISRYDLMPLIYKNQWDPVRRKWKVSDPRKAPTLWRANRYFKSKIRNVVTDTKTGLVTVSITWNDPKLAAKWANDLVGMANDYLRDRAIQESERNITYLNEQASKTDAIGAKQAIYSILQNEINKVMLARGSVDYALKVLDPAFTPEIPSSPILLLWLAIGFAGGLFSAIFVVFASNAWRSGSGRL